jgi:putative ABC transport system permease protein
MRRPWPDRLGRLLPSDIERDAYRPSLADLHVDRAERQVGSLRFGAAVAWTFVECLRLALVTQLARRPSPNQSRKDYVAMFLQDIRRALRLFRLEPGFTAAAVVTLALGIGANTALFAVVEAVLLRPLPYSGADELVILKHRDRASGISKEFIAIGDFVDLRARQQSLERLVGYGGVETTITGEGEPVRVRGLGATPELFAMLRVTPAMGRLFTEDDSRQGAPPVVVIGHELWQTQFGSDPNILSRSIVTGNTRRMVVGVAPPGFHFPPDSPTSVIVPMPVPDTPPAERKAGWIFSVGRLRPGQTAAGAAAEFASLSAQLELEFPGQNRGSEYYVEPLRDALVGDTKRPLLLLLGAVGFVLLIACANVGNLLLARSLARRQEIAVRMALGAGWRRLAAQIVTEALVLGLAGGVLGVLVAWQAAPALAAMVPASTRVPGLDAVGLNPWVLAFSLVASIAAALLFSAVSCMGIANGEQREALTATRRATMGAGPRRAAAGLVVAEIALAAVLLIGAGLTLRSFANLLNVNPGFRTENVLTMQIGLPSGRYSSPASRHDFYVRAFRQLESLAEVEKAGTAAVTPLTGNNWTVAFERPEHPVAAGERAPDVGWQAASGGYFEALDIPLRAGRLFGPRDAAPAPPVVIISEEIARRFFPGENPVGRQVRGGDGTLEIIGVVGDIRRAALTDTPRADMYFPLEQGPQPSTTLFVRTAGDPVLAYPAVRSALRALEPNLIIDGVRSLDDIAASSAALTRLAMRLLAGFAVVALALAAIGIYGVMAYSVRRRTRELGTRVALGASRADILRLVMREGVVITAAGLAAGLAAGWMAARSLTAVLYDVPPSDPATLAAAAAVLALTAMAACYLPARRAAAVDPSRTLAAE